MTNNTQRNILPKKLKSIEYLETILEILNEESDRYVPSSEIKKKFIERLNANGELDNVALENSLNNTLSYAEGINDRIGRPKIDTPAYLADIAQIWQTKLIDMEILTIEGRKENCYMIKVKGIEVLNQLQLNKNIINFKKSSDKISLTIGLLTIFLVIIGVIQIMLSLSPLQTRPSWINPATELLVALIVIGVIIVELNLFFRKDKNKIGKKKPIGKPWQVIVISLFVLLFSIIVILTNFVGVPPPVIEATVTGLFGAYGFYLLEKYVIDAIPIKNKILKYIVSGIVLVIFLFVALLVLIAIEWILIYIGSLLGFEVALVSQNIITEDIGGVVGSWIMYVITVLLGLKVDKS